MQHDSHRDPWWVPMDFHHSIADVRTPVTLVAGWHDIFTPWQLQDFAAMQDADRDARIPIGPLRHTDRGVVREGLVEALALFRAALHADRSGLDRNSVVSGKSVPVRVDLGGGRIIKKKHIQINNKHTIK